MKKLEKRLTAKETLERLNNQWATKRDVMDIGFIGDNNAGKVMNEITTQVLNETDKKLPKGLVPMEYVIKYFDINLSYLKKVVRERY